MWYYSFVKPSIACRALQKVSEPVEMHFLQWHSSLISIHNAHLDFWTTSNVHKNIPAVMLTSIGWGGGRIAEIQGWQVMLLRHCSPLKKSWIRLCPTFPKFPTPSLRLSKISDSDSSTKREWNSAVKINGNRGAQQEITVSASFKRNCTISTGIPNLGVWCKKWSNRTSGVAVRQRNPTPSVVRNPNPTPRKKLRFLTTPAPQP